MVLTDSSSYERAEAETKCHLFDSLPSHLKDVPDPRTPCDEFLSSLIAGRGGKYKLHNRHRDLLFWCTFCNRLVAPPNGISLNLVYNGHNFSLEQQPRVAENDDVSSNKKPHTKISAEILWEGHSVNESYVKLLSEIKKAHPNTFESLTFTTPALYTSALDALGEFYTLFASRPLVEITTEDITYFKDMLRDLEVLRFNVGWLSERLDLIEEMQFNSPLVDAYKESLTNMEAKQKELEELKLVCENQALIVTEKFGFVGDSLSFEFAADGLLAELPTTSSVSE